MVIPKLPIQFADFPNHLYSVSWESFKLRHLMRNSVRIAWKCKDEPVRARLSHHSLFMEPSFNWKQAKRLVFSEIPRVSHYNNNSTRVDCHAAWRRQGRPWKAAPLVKSKRKLLSNKGQLSRIALLVTSPSHSSQARKGILTFFTFEGIEFSFIFKQLSSLLVPPHNKSFAILY